MNTRSQKKLSFSETSDVSLSRFLETESDTLKEGASLAKIIPNECVIYLKGELGAGKTTWVRGFLNALGYNQVVRSPTYTLVEHYPLPNKSIYHFDFYRINAPSEIEELGMRDYIPHSILLIEWPEKGKGYLPNPDLEYDLSFQAKSRAVCIKGKTERGRTLINSL